MYPEKSENMMTKLSKIDKKRNKLTRKVAKHSTVTKLKSLSKSFDQDIENLKKEVEDIKKTRIKGIFL